MEQGLNVGASGGTSYFGRDVVQPCCSSPRCGFTTGQHSLLRTILYTIFQRSVSSSATSCPYPASLDFLMAIFKALLASFQQVHRFSHMVECLEACWKLLWVWLLVRRQRSVAILSVYQNWGFWYGKARLHFATALRAALAIAHMSVVVVSASASAWS